MKSTPDSTKRSASLLAAVLFSHSASAQIQSDPPPASDHEPVASDPANPESEPLEDRSKRANPDAKPVEDRGRKAGRDSRPVEDDDVQRANEEAEEVEDNGKTAGDQARPAKDGKPSAANEKSPPVADQEEEQAKREATPVEDKERPKAETPADKVEDESTRASRKAGQAEEGEDDKSNPAARRGAGKGRPNRGAERGGRDGDPAPVEEEAVAEPSPDVMPAGEPPVDSTPEAKEAEAAVKKATEEAETKIAGRKLEIRGEAEARGLIDDILGKESSISRAEIERERRAGARRPDRRDDRGPASRPEAGREQLAEAALYLRQRLQGEVEPREAPAFFRQAGSVEDRGRRELQPGEVRETRRDRIVAPLPRYFHQGRRYVHFDSRESIPAILLATAALDRVRVQPAREVRQNFFDGSQPAGTPLPPEEYRGDGAWVVSYPVSEKSMVSSNDILFRQGSTQFSDGHSYDMVLALTDALEGPALAKARFIVEGHASAEGSYADNMELSQRRAEAIVREMVRGGISPDRLVPVGYGESEARYAADAPESRRREDRRVVVFRMDDSPVTSR